MKRLVFVKFICILGLFFAYMCKASENQSVHDSTSKSEDINFEVANVHQINLDTVEIDGGGNWLHKKIWYERAQIVFDEIRLMVDSVGNLRIQFMNEVNAIGQKIDNFYETVNFTKGQLDEKFKQMLAALENEQKLVGDLSPEERNLQTNLKQQATVIDQIGKDIKTIIDVDNKIDQTLMQAFKTIDECRDYETKAWNAFKSIGKELDDKKARNYYYQMNNYKQNLEQKLAYLKSTLLPYLHNALVLKIEQNITKINTAIEQLKTKGIDLEKIMNDSEQEDVDLFHKREKEASEIAVKKALEEAAEKSMQAAKQERERYQKALQQAEDQSFYAVMQQYYNVTFGKIVNFTQQMYFVIGLQYLVTFFESYSFPLLNYARNAIHHIIENIMEYFDHKPSIKDKKIDKTLDKQKEVGAEETTKNVHDDTSSSDEKKDSSEVQAEHHQNDDASNSDQVKVQSLKNDTLDDKKILSENDSHVTSLHQLFISILKFIETLIKSLYACVIQFFKMLMQLSSYITAAY
ncbi:MAG: hypothetical protein ACXWL5_00085 [Candidatus Chromulinivorax sp.]